MSAIGRVGAKVSLLLGIFLFFTYDIHRLVRLLFKNTEQGRRWFCDDIGSLRDNINLARQIYLNYKCSVVCIL